MSSPYLRKLITDDVDELALEYRRAIKSVHSAECIPDRAACLREMQLIRSIGEYRFGLGAWGRACDRSRLSRRSPEGEGG